MATSLEASVTDRNLSSGSDRDWAVVAAIDFGTSNTGYAFAFRDSNYEVVTASSIQLNKWHTDSSATEKAPTTVLLNRDEIFHSFGYNAEKHFSMLCDKKKQEGWWYFERFKMSIYDRKLSRNDKMKDAEGKSMPAINVFSTVIGYLKESILHDVRLQNRNVKDEDVLYVLTVPAIWSDAAKQFMREAATATQIKRRTKRVSPSALAAYAVQSSSLEHEDHLDVKYISAYKDSRAQVQHQGAQHRDMDPRLQKPSEPTNKPEVMAMTQDELKQVTDHMGHSLAIHTDVYRLQTSVLERTKVARALVALEEGKLTKSNSNQDTNLSTIDLDDLPAPLLQSDDDEEEEEGVQVEDKMEEFTTHNSDINEESSTVTAANTSKGIKRKRWSEKEDADFMEGFGNHIKKKKTVSAREIRAIKSKFMSLKDRSEAVIRARINNICLGKIKCKLN